MKTNSQRCTAAGLLCTLTAMLAVASAAHAALREWDGDAPMDNTWMTAANWAGNVEPNPGDDLLFLSGARHPNNENNYPSGTTFNSIELRGGGPGQGYTLSGNSIALNAGLRVENNSGVQMSHTVNNSLLLNSNQTFTVINPSGFLFLAGPINLSARDLAFDVSAGSEAQVQAVISGAGGLLKTNAGLLALSSNNTYTGGTTLDGGTLQINGSQPASPVLLNAGTLKGTGTVGTLTSVGSGGPGSILLSPGASPGILTCSNVALNSSTAFAVELNSTTPGNGYDQLAVNGSVTLNNAALSVTLGFSPAVGTSFVIINNDGADAVSGTFSGLPGGTFFTNSGAVFRITYAGGDGNDVVLARVNPPAQFTSITKLGNGTVQLQAAGLPNLTYTIQANTNLSTTNWTAIGTAPADGSGVFTFTDTNAPLFPLRFYRALSP